MRLDIGTGDDLVKLVRGAAAESLVVVIAPDLLPLSMATMRAAIEPLAIERAPHGRLNAVLPAATSDPAHVDAVVAFLERAASTTGQLLEIS